MVPDDIVAEFGAYPSTTLLDERQKSIIIAGVGTLDGLQLYPPSSF